MEFKEVREVKPIEQKSSQEIEQGLLDKHQETLDAQEASVEAERAVDIVEAAGAEAVVEQEAVELEENDVLSYIQKRYDKDISSVDDFFSNKQENEPLPEDVSKYLKFKKETGRGFEDFVKANRSYDNLDDDQLLSEYKLS